jgi:predicted dehydrogenase
LVVVSPFIRLAKENNRLRVGVLGAGAWAVALHIPTLASRSDVRLVGVMRRNEDAVRRVQERFGFENASTDYQDILQLGLDLVVVASPVASHHELVLAALESGAHVLVEKPFAIEPSDAWEMVHESARRGRHLVIALGWHYQPMVMAAKDFMEGKSGVGAIEHIAISMSSPTRAALLGQTPQFTSGNPRGGGFVSPLDNQPRDPDLASQAETMMDPAVSGGGYGQAQLSHALGLALWLTGLRGSSVYALMLRPKDSAVEYHDALAIQYNNGAIGTVSGSSSHLGANGNKHALQVHITGSDGELLLDLGREHLSIVTARGKETKLPFGPGDGLYTCDGPVHAACDLALGKDVVNASPGDLGARTVEILAAAYRSAGLGSVVRVAGLDPSLSPDDSEPSKAD